METVIIQRGDPQYPRQLEQMHKPPPTLYVRGASLASLLDRPKVSVVGTRRMSAYGKQVTQQFVTPLAGQGIVIVSGLALGVDAAAHRSALQAGGLTIAVLPSPVEDPAPHTNQRLAQQILDNGGALVSTYPAGSEPHKGNFVARNELVAALSDIVLVTEATIDSGTRHTVAFADKLSTEIYAVPGAITSPYSAGCNSFIAHNGAHLAASPNDLLQALQLTEHRSSRPRGKTREEQCLINLLSGGTNEGYQLLEESQLPVHIYNQTLTMLELSGTVIALGGDRWGLA